MSIEPSNDRRTAFGNTANNQRIAQTVTASGTLTEVRIAIVCLDSAPMTLTIEALTSGLPNGTALRTESVTP